MMEKTNIYRKLFEAKKEIGKISKDSTNPFYKSKYFDINQLLEHVEPILQKHNLLLIQPILDNKVITKLWDIETDTNVTSEMELTNISDPQKRGSEITYYRRYTLGSLLGLQATDDDGNLASQETKSNSQDTRPWLDDKGFSYLLEKGSIEEIQVAFKSRRMKKDYRTQLENKLK